MKDLITFIAQFVNGVEDDTNGKNTQHHVCMLAVKVTLRFQLCFRFKKKKELLSVHLENVSSQTELPVGISCVAIVYFC